MRSIYSHGRLRKRNEIVPGARGWLVGSARLTALSTAGSLTSFSARSTQACPGLRTSGSHANRPPTIWLQLAKPGKQMNVHPRFYYTH